MMKENTIFILFLFCFGHSLSLIFFQLAGILLDTENLSAAAKYSTNRDAEAVQLLLVGSPSSHRHVFYERCTILFFIRIVIFGTCYMGLYFKHWFILN